MSSLKAVDVEKLNRFFNSDGYVFDFSTDRFNDFTLNSIGIPLCEKIGLSKGKSLRSFIQDGEDQLVRKLLFDLFEYYDTFLVTNDYFKKDDELYKQCKIIVESLTSKAGLITQIDRLKNEFNSDYMLSQIQTMEATIESNPTEAIGKAKELLESCFLTILKKENVNVDKDWDLPRLSKETFGLLSLTPDDIPDEKKAKEVIKRILGNLANITTGIAELRNPYGSGHGKDMEFKGLSPRHAHLAVGSATTLVYFIWDTYQEQKKKDK